MTLDSLLAQLDNVRNRGTGKWSARCPAHADKSPSLSIAEGDRGILLRCFAGCEVADICRALNIQQRDLFFEVRPDPQAMRQREQARERRRRQQEVDGLLIDACRAAEQHIHSRRNIDITGWSDERLGRELDGLAAAYHIIEDHGINGY